MNQSRYMQQAVVRFRRWSRKGYAVFCSLTAQVTIGRVCKSICEMALRKSGRGLCRQRNQAQQPDGQNQYFFHGK